MHSSIFNIPRHDVLGYWDIYNDIWVPINRFVKLDKHVAGHVTGTYNVINFS